MKNCLKIGFENFNFINKVNNLNKKLKKLKSSTKQVLCFIATVISQDMAIQKLS